MFTSREGCGRSTRVGRHDDVIAARFIPLRHYGAEERVDEANKALEAPKTILDTTIKALDETEKLFEKPSKGFAETRNALDGAEKLLEETKNLFDGAKTRTFSPKPKTTELTKEDDH